MTFRQSLDHCSQTCTYLLAERRGGEVLPVGSVIDLLPGIAVPANRACGTRHAA